MRLGKKLFKIIRIELESLKSKEKFLKKAKRKSEFGKERLLSNKLAYSETTRIKERTLEIDNIEKEKKEKDKSIRTENVQKDMLKQTNGTRYNTTNINNTEGNDSKSIEFKKKENNQTEVIQENENEYDFRVRKVKTELDDTIDGNNNQFNNVMHLDIDQKSKVSVSGSEIDLDGVFNAEQNEFIRVMVNSEISSN
jgi:hypothetical protein